MFGFKKVLRKKIVKEKQFSYIWLQNGKYRRKLNIIKISYNG